MNPKTQRSSASATMHLKTPQESGMSLGKFCGVTALSPAACRGASLPSTARKQFILPFRTCRDSK